MQKANEKLKMLTKKFPQIKLVKVSVSSTTVYARGLMTKTTSPNISNSNQEKRNVFVCTSTENRMALLGKQAQISSLTAEVFILTVTSQNNVELHVLTEIVMVILLLIFISV